MKENKKTAIIIGAGPAGLSAAYSLLKNTDYIPIILEEDDAVGGLSRSFDYEGNKIDAGVHRFFSKNEDVKDLWFKLLHLQSQNDDTESEKIMLERDRVSRIYYKQKLFNYPISLTIDTIINLGIITTIRSGISYIWSSLFKRKEVTLEDFMINRFGKVLYSIFFKNYTHKVWGVYPGELSKEWGEQRIKKLSLAKTIFNALLTPIKKLFKTKNETETSLIDHYYYPKYGSGQYWQTLADEIIKLGGEIHLNTKVIAIAKTENRISKIKTDGKSKKEWTADVYVSSMPIKDLITSMQNSVPPEVAEVATNLPYRDFTLVGLLLKNMKLKNNTKFKTQNNICPDSWLYIQDDFVRMGRIDIVNNWSPYMVKDTSTTLIGLEYFCNEGDDIWNKPDEQFIQEAIQELLKLDLADKKDIIDSFRIKVKKAYPAYYGSYENFGIVKKHLDTVENLYCIGRNGQHKYNNMDHSMMCGFELAKLLKDNNSNKASLWDVNTENTYQE